MLRTYFMQQWFNLSDPGVEEAFYESATLRRFAGVDLGVAPAPEETTVLRFRHLLEKHDLGGAMLEVVNLHMEAKGIRIARREGDSPGRVRSHLVLVSFPFAIITQFILSVENSRRYSISAGDLKTFTTWK
jgi:IS5 family transposase